MTSIGEVPQAQAQGGNVVGNQTAGTSSHLQYSGRTEKQSDRQGSLQRKGK